MTTVMQKLQLNKLKMHNQHLIKIVFAPLLVLVLHILATVFDWYDICWWLDKPMHFLGGVGIAVSAYYLIAYFVQSKKIQINWRPLQILAVTAIVALCAVSWEFLEFYLDLKSFAVMQPSVRDTITDLVMGLAGGMISAIIAYRKTAK